MIRTKLFKRNLNRIITEFQEKYNNSTNNIIILLSSVDKSLIDTYYDTLRV